MFEPLTIDTLTHIHLLNMNGDDMRVLRRALESSPSAPQKIAVPLAKYLQLWKANDWIDNEKIYILSFRLARIGLWKQLSAENFIASLEPQPEAQVLEAFRRGSQSSF